MEAQAANLLGMNAQEAKEYIFHYITTLKLTEKQHQALEGKLAQWEKRVDLARSRGFEDLARGAEEEAERVKERQRVLSLEMAALESQIEQLRRQIPALAARERSVDPDILEQELLMALGRLPGDADSGNSTEAALNRAVADAALEALKAKMGVAAGSSAGGAPA